MTFSIKNIVDYLNALYIGATDNFFVENVSIDSRSLQNNSGTLFFALKGNNHDAHLYLSSLVDKGIRYFVVEYIPNDLKGKANFIVVKNTHRALQETSKYYRNLFNFNVIGITGSNGKTIVKEWLNYFLSSDYNVVRSPKSYNSQVGVPLSIFGINENHNLGIFEAGISQPGEMEILEEIIKPTIGVFTHFGNAHNEGFNSKEEKLSEKIKLFKNCKIVVLESNLETENKINSEKITWSFINNKADVFFENINNTIRVNYKDKIFELNIPFNDEISLKNCATCITTLLFLNFSTKKIKELIKTLFPVEIRLQAKKGLNNCLLIDDSYSADYQSIKIALDFLEQQKLHSKKTVILSDVFQSGLSTEQLYKKVATSLQNNNISRVIVIGKTISKYLKELPNVIGFLSTQDFLQQFNTQSFENETILIKGARSFNFDEIVVLLEEKKHETVLEINLDAITHNLNFYKSKLKPQTKIMVMVKAFGYGNGGFEIAKLLEHHKINYLGVAFADEGISLRNAGITMPIMVLNPENSSFAAMIAYNLEPEIYSINGLEEFIKIAQQKNVNYYPVHLKIDTGMHRLGFENHQLHQLISIIKATNIIKITSIFSHLAASDDVSFSEFTSEQFNRFEYAYSEISKALNIFPLKHILNTSGIYNYADKQYDMVRLGIGIYGIGNSDEENLKLQNVSTLKSVISQIKTLKAGESVGYSRKYMVKEITKIATIPIGYADGIKRAWGNEKGFVTINNSKATILGNICMDMIMVDVTNILCNEGDEVIIFGENPKIIDIAKVTNTISYEIITGISQRVKRIFYKN